MVHTSPGSIPALPPGIASNPAGLTRKGVEKVGDISTLVSSGRRAAVLAEIAKCEVVCANCHRLRTFGL